MAGSVFDGSRSHIPDARLMALTRGLLDGDGSIINEVYRADTSRRSDCFREYLKTRFTSASRPHLDWLEARIRALTGLYGSVGEVKRKAPDPTRHPFFASSTASSHHSRFFRFSSDRAKCHAWSTDERSATRTRRGTASEVR